MPNNEQDNIPFGGDAASMAGSTASSMFEGCVDARLSGIRKQKEAIATYMADWMATNRKVRTLDFRSATPEGLQNLALVEECDERQTTLVDEIVRMVTMAHKVLDKNDKRDQKALNGLARWIEMRTTMMRDVGLILPLADDDDDMLDNIPTKDDITGRKRDRSMDQSDDSTRQPTKQLRGREMNDTSNFTNDIGGDQIEVGGVGRRVNFELLGATAATSPRTPTMNLQRVVDERPGSEPAAIRKRKKSEGGSKTKDNNDKDSFLMPPPRTIGLGRGQG